MAPKYKIATAKLSRSWTLFFHQLVSLYQKNTFMLRIVLCLRASMKLRTKRNIQWSAKSRNLDKISKFWLLKNLTKMHTVEFLNLLFSLKWYWFINISSSKLSASSGNSLNCKKINSSSSSGACSRRISPILRENRIYQRDMQTVLFFVIIILVEI